VNAGYRYNGNKQLEERDHRCDRVKFDLIGSRSGIGRTMRGYLGIVLVRMYGSS
jgi:hypothetical protein